MPSCVLITSVPLRSSPPPPLQLEPLLAKAPKGRQSFVTSGALQRLQALAPPGELGPKVRCRGRWLRGLAMARCAGTCSREIQCGCAPVP